MSSPSNLPNLSTQAIPTNPFLKAKTTLPIVALKSKRNGYIMIAPKEEITDYASLPDIVLLAAKAWAAQLESLGSPRAYWITLSEATPHLHIHIFPRWLQDDLKGIALFERRDTDPQPTWTVQSEQALFNWAQTYQVEIINPE
jgi:diadenosine tetraphosphate (Ap4A) HIT family hydrolase